MLRKHRQEQREEFPDADLGEAPRTQGVIGQVITLFHQKGYGFLVAGGVQYFFHWKDFIIADDFNELVAGDYVTFEPRTSARGPRAAQIARA
jgi:cold shock CspA family protein